MIYFFPPYAFKKIIPWPLCTLYSQFKENRSETRSYPPAASEHSDHQISKHQVHLRSPTCLTCRDPCQAGPEFTQMLIRTDPESTGIMSHTWWSGGNCFFLLHCAHWKGLILMDLLSNLYQECFLTTFINLKIETWFVFTSAVEKQGIALKIKSFDWLIM